MPHQGSRTTVLGNVTPRAEVQKAREIEHDGGQKRERPQDRMAASKREGQYQRVIV